MKSERITLTPPPKPPQGEIVLSGSKSFTNRALIAAALAPGESTLLYPSDSNDTELLIAALRKIGVEIKEQSDALTVSGTGGQFQPFAGEIDIGPAGTTSRFLLPLLAHIPEGEIVLRGTDRMHERPIGILVDALRVLGADIHYQKSEGCLPLVIKGTGGLRGGALEIDASMSSQFLSALLLFAPLLPEGFTLHWKGELVSKSYIAMTAQTLGAFGVRVIEEAERLIVEPHAQYQSARYKIEGDASGGSYFWGLAAITGGEILVRNISSSSAQGDAQFPYELQKMGCEVLCETNDGIAVRGSRNLKAISTCMELMPDTAQTLSVVAAFAEGETTITGLKTLKVKETDRLQALHVELAKAGITTCIGDDRITVSGGDPKAATIETYHDHRMAMALALLGARVPGVVILDPSVVNKSFPAFWDKLAHFGVGVELA